MRPFYHNKTCSSERNDGETTKTREEVRCHQITTGKHDDYCASTHFCDLKIQKIKKLLGRTLHHEVWAKDPAGGGGMPPWSTHRAVRSLPPIQGAQEDAEQNVKGSLPHLLLQEQGREECNAKLSCGCPLI